MWEQQHLWAGGDVGVFGRWRLGEVGSEPGRVVGVRVRVSSGAW